MIFLFDDAKNFIFAQIMNEVNFQILYRFCKIFDNRVYFLCNYEKRIYHEKSESVFFAQILSNKLIARKFVYYCVEIFNNLTRRFQLSYNNADILYDDYCIVKNREISNLKFKKIDEVLFNYFRASKFEQIL